ncbi:MAG TPA: hypothetical protein VFR34_13985, partial [Paracoccaceae bacterium]|nr:hypothetical protein [Paracoccaceae bacterium]
VMVRRPVDSRFILPPSGTVSKLGSPRPYLRHPPPSLAASVSAPRDATNIAEPNIQQGTMSQTDSQSSLHIFPRTQ